MCVCVCARARARAQHTLWFRVYLLLCFVSVSFVYLMMNSVIYNNTNMLSTYIIVLLFLINQDSEFIKTKMFCLLSNCPGIDYILLNAFV